MGRRLTGTGIPDRPSGGRLRPRMGEALPADRERAGERTPRSYFDDRMDDRRDILPLLIGGKLLWLSPCSEL